jgi:hypothetical protein
VGCANGRSTHLISINVSVLMVVNAGVMDGTANAILSVWVVGLLVFKTTWGVFFLDWSRYSKEVVRAHSAASCVGGHWLLVQVLR